MSNKVIITSDITCDLNKDLEQRYGVTTIPLHIVIGGKSYEDWVNITPEELYEIFYQTKELPHTTAGSVGEFMSQTTDAAAALIIDGVMANYQPRDEETDGTEAAPVATPTVNETPAPPPAPAPTTTVQGTATGGVVTPF